MVTSQKLNATELIRRVAEWEKNYIGGKEIKELDTLFLLNSCAALLDEQRRRLEVTVVRATQPPFRGPFLVEQEDVDQLLADLRALIMQWRHAAAEHLAASERYEAEEPYNGITKMAAAGAKALSGRCAYSAQKLEEVCDKFQKS